MNRILIALLCCCSTVVWAAPCAFPKEATGDGLAALSDAQRLAFLSSHLSKEGERARTWTLAWGGAFGVLTIGQIAAAPLFAAEDKPDMYWGALSSAVGVAFTVLVPLNVLTEGSVFMQKARAATADDTCALIAEGERMLEIGAAQEALSQRWFAHVGNVLLNVGFGLILGLGYGHWSSGLLNMGVGIAVGEATIFTAPTELISGWKRYRKGDLSTGISIQVVPTAGPGLGLVMHF